MVRPVAFAAIIVLLASSGAFVARVPAQQDGPVQKELLTEVRLLRQAIESLAGTNSRVQIVFGRLQLQEQRTASAARRLDEAREALARMTGEIAAMADHLRDMESGVADSRRKPEDVEQMRVEGEMAKRQIERMEADRARMAGDEAEAASALNAEQGRSADLNRQLEELERLLSKPPR